MRIAFVVNHFPALSETFILNQITGLIDRGHEVDIFALGSKQDPTVHPDVEKYGLLERTFYQPLIPASRWQRVIKGARLFLANFRKAPLSLVRSLNVLKYRKFLRVFQFSKQNTPLMLLYAAIPFVQKQPYDVIHCHFGLNGLKAVLLRDIGALRGSITTVFHGYDITLYPQQVGEHLYDHLFAKGDLFLPISDRWRSRLVELGCDSTKILVHHMGIDTQRFTYRPRQYQNQAPRVQLLTIARLVEKKGVEYSIRAVGKLAQRYSNLEYIVIGDGPLKADLQQLVQTLQIESMVKLVGWQQQQTVIQFLNRADILVAPSVTSQAGDQEGIPVVLMEAMAMGLPVVSTFHSGIPELVQDGVSGCLVPERSADALADKLAWLIEQPQHWLALSQAAHTTVVEQFDIHRLNDRLVEIFEQVVPSQVPTPEAAPSVLPG